MSLPNELQELRAWLVWGLPNAKMRKQPYYASGVPRSGRNGSIEDRAQLVTNAEARTAKAVLKAEGVGLAMLPEHNLIALDFDGGVDSGVVRPEILALIADTYAELSPSGKGVRAFFKGSAPTGADNRTAEEKAAGEFGFEVFADTKYVTVTGKQLPGSPDAIAELPQSVRNYAAARFGPRAERAAAEPAQLTVATEITDEQVADLRSALAHSVLLEAAADNAVWSEVGYALLSLGAVGLALWREFSAKAPNGDGPQTAETWWAAHSSQPPRSDFRRIFNLATARGWENPGARPKVASLEDFPVAEAQAAATAAAVGEVPRALHLCTDQANANRIKEVFGKRLISVAGAFYGWAGTHWARDEGLAARCAAKLSAIVKQEAKAARAKYEALAARNNSAVLAAMKHPQKSALSKTPEGQELLAAEASAKALEQWGVKCEMKATQEAALGLLRKLITVEANQLDSDRFALNCLNGTVDLRTSELRPHNPDDHITRCAPVKFNRDASAPRFERFLLEITRDNVPLVNFLRRWFGYCTTGDVREQKFVVHIGPGGNGKGTLLNIIEELLGDYADTAAPGLLTGKGAERHPTEIASLMGRRMVTAHEPDDNAELREGFIKQATGADQLSGRWMRGDFFKFTPTHKLQLLTNPKPTIKGTDYGIWRRVLMVVYPVRFGSEADIAAGKATQPVDMQLTDSLRAEREGIFAWLVRGAAEWFKSGLNPPDSVLASGREYREEQDRIGHFVTERCIFDRDSFTALAVLYSTYTIWCRASGYFPMSRHRFGGELERVVPEYRKAVPKLTLNGARKEVPGCYGLRLNPEYDLFPAEPEVSPVQAADDCSDLLGAV